jgi:hypothetical protein
MHSLTGTNVSGTLDPAVQFPDDTKKLGRWIGVAHDVGSPMTFWVLPQSCKGLARSTVVPLTADKESDPVVRARIVELDLSIKEKIGHTLDDKELVAELTNIFPDVPDDIFLPDLNEDNPIDKEAVMPEADNYTPKAYDEYLTAECYYPTWGL